MKIYISSSWKNREKVREMANRLKKDGHKVFDFTDSNCRKIAERPPEKQQEPFDPDKHKSYADYMKSEKAAYMYAAIMNNQEAIRWCDLVILLLPCGNDAHADWAYGVGLGKKSVVVGQPRKGEQSYTQLWADKILDNPNDVYKFIKEYYEG
ncbi:MAG: toll/interleukin-1 receptor domain-containing protein [Firmicutes bacterium]|nr:toll/interleukin-1 receptor domain-containing protein [Bacillota bacterium]